MKKNKSLFIILGSGLLMAILFVIGMKMYKGQESERIETIVSDNFKTLVADHAMKKGNPEAKVFVVEFFDPECESCREFNPYMHSIMADYEGKIQLVMRYAPFHGNSIFAIKILEAARKQDKYWEALEILYQHQPEWGNHHNPQPELVWNYLPRLNIDVEKLKSQMEDPAIQKIIEQDQIDGKTLDVRMTPTFFVNGKLVEPFGPDELRMAIDQALKGL